MDMHNAHYGSKDELTVIKAPSIEAPFIIHPLSIVILVIGAIGLISNAFTLVVVCTAKDFTKKHSGVFICHQTVMDLLASAVLLVTESTNIADIRATGFLGEVYCRLLKSHSLLWICLKGSTLNLINLSLERYLQIVFPIYHRQRFTHTKTACLLVSTWILTIALNVHLFLTCFNQQGFCNFKNSIMNNNTVQLVYGFVEIIAVYFIPLVTLTYFYSHMLYVIRQQVQKRKDSSRNHSGENGQGSKNTCLSTAQVNLVKTFILVSVLYVVCWTPTQLYCLLFGLRKVTGQEFSTPFRDSGYHAGLALAMLNICVNPVVYACKFEAFKTQAAHLLRWKAPESSSSQQETETML